jgi:hypothetical protein
MQCPAQRNGSRHIKKKYSLNKLLNIITIIVIIVINNNNEKQTIMKIMKRTLLLLRLSYCRDPNHEHAVVAESAPSLHVEWKEKENWQPS